MSKETYWNAADKGAMNREFDKEMLGKCGVIAERMGLALQQATLDAQNYGVGWIRVAEDGELHRVDPTKIIIQAVAQ